MRRISIRVGVVILFALAAALSWNALSYINFDSHYGFLKLKQQAIASGWYLPGYYAHVLIAAVILLIGIFQIYPPLGMRSRPLHKLLGKIYVFGILFFSAPGGLVMSLFINRGPMVLASFVLQSILWFMFTLLAFTSIRNRDVLRHRAWMWRSMALTLAAITLRVYAFTGTSLGYDLTLPVAYASIAWASWVVNWIIVELYLKYGKASGFRFQVPD